MNAIVPFDFETNAVRIVMIDHAPWFVAADVCRVLAHSNIRQAISRWLDDDEKGVTTGYTLGGKQEMNIVSESGLFALILRSKTSAAKRFRKWVTAEVLPSIRRDGTYRLPRSEQAGLQMKREFFASLPPAQKAMAIQKADALRQIDKLLDEGIAPGAALAAVVAETGIGKRTLYYARCKVWMVAPSDYEAALAPRWRAGGARGMLAECHPDAMIRWFQINRHGSGIADNYRRLMEEALTNDWSPIPSERTMRRVIVRLMPQVTAPKGKRLMRREG